MSSALACPLCGNSQGRPFEVVTQEASPVKVSVETHVARGRGRSTAYQCPSCTLVYLSDYEKERNAVYYDSGYAAWGDATDEEQVVVAEAKKDAFRQQLKRLLAHMRPEGKKLLDVGTGMGYLLDVAAEEGFDVHAVEISSHAAGHANERFPGKIVNKTLDAASFADASFDVITMTDLIEHVADPLSLMKEAARILKPGGHLFVITPNTDSFTRALLGPRWFQYKYEHVTYWNAATLANLLKRFGLDIVEVRRNDKRFNLSYYHHYFRKYSLLGLENIFQGIYALLPEGARRWSFTNPVTGELLLVAKSRSEQK